MIGPPQQLFLLDANIFITAHRSYYALNLCPGFWECLIYYFHTGRILSIDRVRSELTGQGDALSLWVAGVPEGLFAASLEETVTDAYREVMRWVYANVQFSSQAKDEFSRGADGWLAAYAKPESTERSGEGAGTGHHRDGEGTVPADKGHAGPIVACCR